MTTLDLPVLPPGFSLAHKYTTEEGRIYLTGVQALVRLALDRHRADRRAGLRTATFIAGYRGSPLGGFDMELERNKKLLDSHHVVHSPALNEELAATALLGTQTVGIFPGPKYDGVAGIWYGKGPGVDRTGDAFKHANYAGTARHGGVLALGGDDPASKSSTLPSASEVAFYDALMPVLYPGNVQDVLDLGLHGFALSRASGLWVGFKAVTNVCDGAGTAEVAPDRVRPVIPVVELDGKPYVHAVDWRLAPPHNLEFERTLHTARLEIARRYAAENGLNRITVPSPEARLGIVAAGKTYYDLRQALDALGLDDAALDRAGVRLLKIGMLFPLEAGTVRHFARGLREVLVIEEKRAFLETFLKDALYSLPDRPLVTGKQDSEGRMLVPAHGELDPDIITRAVAARLGRYVELPSVTARIAYLDGVKGRPSPATLPRTAYYCSGCPHNRSAPIPEGSIVAAGIGCHSMSLWMDPSITGTIAGITQMGGEGAQWAGAAPFTETKHIFQNIGDGTLFHSGQLAINYAVASGVNITYKVLYNSAVAMTGGQPATGTLPVPALVRRLEAEGVKRIIITTDEPEKYRGLRLSPIAQVRHRDDIVEAERELAATAGVTVLIHDQQCAAEKRRLRKRGLLPEPAARVHINERVCEGCGDCGHTSNCLSVQPVETEFGRKTRIHQSSCNQDFSCLLGDCPAFVTVETVPRQGAGQEPSTGTPLRPAGALSHRSGPAGAGALPSSPISPASALLTAPVPPAGRPAAVSVHMMGIGGTGVVTVNQILGTAALLDGKQVWGLDQTGLSQKGGPVVSDLRIGDAPFEAAKVAAGGADLYIGFDLLVAADARNLAVCDPARTVAIISTSRVPTGQMVSDVATRFPEVEGLLAGVRHAVRATPAPVFLDAQAACQQLFGDHMPANMLLLGAAFQTGMLPLSGTALEQAIRLNGAAVEQNLAAFRWGRALAANPDALPAAPVGAAPDSQPHPLLEGFTGELRRLLAVRVPELIAYQDEAYARRYVRFMRAVARIEGQKTPGQTALAEAVARNLYKLMAYKDEYEVARLHLEALERQAYGPGARVTLRLHPPLLRALGLKQKLAFGSRFTPALRALRAGKRLRGTPLDPFGHTEVRRTEREIIAEYRRMIATVCAGLTAESHAEAVRLAALPDMVRGYEQIKLASVECYRAAVRR